MSREVSRRSLIVDCLCVRPRFHNHNISFRFGTDFPIDTIERKRMNATITPTLSERMVEYISRSPATIAVETSVFLFIGLIAIGGNLLVVISIYRNPSLRTISNYFVLSLAVSDILYPVTALPLTIVWSVESSSIPGKRICVFQAIASFGLLFVSVTTMVVMAVNRFVCVCKPQKYKIVFSKKKSLVIIGVVWIINFTLMTINFNEQVLHRADFEPNKIWCGLVLARKTSLTTIIINVVFVVILVVPFSIIFYCYFKVFDKIREHKKNVAPTCNPNNLGTSVQEIKVTRTMFTVLIGYCATWIPVLIIVLVSIHTRVPREGHMMVTYVVASSSAINPVIYGVMNNAFRQEYKKIIKCR